MTDDLTRKLDSKDLGERLAGIKQVGHLKSDSGIPLLIRMLRDKSNHAVAAAAKGLESHVAREAIGPLIHAYGRLKKGVGQSDPGCVGKWQIVTTLSKLITSLGVDPGATFHDDGDTPSEQPFDSVSSVLFDAIQTVQIERSGNGLDDVAVGLRGQAALGLAKTQSDGALLAISLLLFDTKSRPELLKPPEEEPFVTLLARRSAARALSVLGDPAGVALLGVKLTYPSDELPELLVECMDAIAFLDGAAALQLVSPYLTYGDAGASASNLYLTAGAATALASLPNSYHEQVSQLLVNTCRQSILPDVKESIALALASMRSDVAYFGFRQLVEDDAPEVRLAAVTALAVRGSNQSKDFLRNLRDKDREREVSLAAGEALASIE